MELIGRDGKAGCATAAALGIFDGVHLGHRRVVTEAVRLAEKAGIEPSVFTFETATVTTKGRRDVILTDEDKLRRFEELGIKYTYSADFADLRELSPEEFVRDILVGRLGARYVVCGENFHFGKGGTADAGVLREICGRYGITTSAVEQLKIGGERVSTTRIRELIRSGGVAAANALLGYRYSYRLEVVHGAHIGRTWDFPTINQPIPDGLIKPRFGVYCAKVLIDGKWLPGVCNIGVKPTVENSSPPAAETFIIDYSGDLYGRVLELELHEFIRPEMRFSHTDELRAEIARNTAFVRNYFGI